MVVVAVEVLAEVGMKVETALVMEAVAMVDKKEVEAVTVVVAATDVEKDMDPQARSLKNHL